MAKGRIGTRPPQVGVSSNKGPKVVGTDGKPLKKEPEKHSDDVPAIDPRVMCMGQFAIPQTHVRMKLDDVQEFMKDVVIIRCELQMAPQGNVFNYTGISPKYFKSLPEGSAVPVYNVARRIDGVFIVEPMGMPTAPTPPVTQ